MAMVNAELYDFMKINECHLFRRKSEIVAWVVVDFDELGRFQEIVGNHHFDEGGMEVTMWSGYVAVELNSIIDIKDYKNCFERTEWREYFAGGAK